MSKIDIEALVVEPSNNKATVVREVVVQYRGPRFVDRTGIRDHRNAADFLRKLLPDNSREHFITLYLDGAHTVLGYSILNGFANSCAIHPREVFQPAILLGSIAILVSHNHPSGQITPSDEDDKITHLLSSSADLLGLKLLDHIILGDANMFYSYADARRPQLGS